MKKIVAILLALLLGLTGLLPVSAAGGKVTYDGRARECVFAPGSEYSLTDLFPNFKDVMPGDTLSQPITVKNDAADKVKIKIYIRSLGAHEESEEFLSQLRLKVAKSAKNDMAYMFDAAADETAGLTDWVYLGTLYSGGKVNLDVTLEVPTSLTNEYQEQIGYLDWEFMIKELPVEDGDPVAPETGDAGGILPWLAALVGAAALLLLVLLMWRRRREKADEA